MPLKTIHYSNGEMTISWKPELCTHSGNCVRGLGEVFNVRHKPWIDVSKATTPQLIEQVKKCPSGALSFTMNEKSE
jgi:uncharacterized Fe-S cluster protein YjdI